jgi:HPt (histidine-containing phosphotransfer) domain-containing protein
VGTRARAGGDRRQCRLAGEDARLFLQELPLQREQLQQAQARGDATAVGALLHKLRASCGFVGAARLARAVEALSRSPLDGAALRDFGFAAEDTLAAADQS